MNTPSLNEMTRARQRESRERQQLQAKLESMSPAERLREQEIEFPTPEGVQPLAGGRGLRVVPSGGSSDRACAAAELAGRLCRQPERVLEDILLAQQSDPERAQDRCLSERWGAGKRPRLEGARARYRHATAGLADPRRAGMHEVAASLGVAAVGELTECQHPACPMGRLAHPQVRAAGERELARTLWREFGDTSTLCLSLVGPGGCFAESVLLCRLFEQGFRRVEVNLVETQFGPLVAAARGDCIAGPRVAGYSPRMHRTHGLRLGQVVELMDAVFDDFALYAFSSAVDCIAAHTAGQVPASHATICLDPGLEGVALLDLRWNAALLQRHAGAPGGLLAVADAAPGLLVTRPPPRDLTGDALQGVPSSNPAFWVGRWDEPGGEEGMQRAMDALEAAEGPAVVQRSLTAALSGGGRFRLTETFRAWRARKGGWAVEAGAVTLGATLIWSLCRSSASETATP